MIIGTCKVKNGAVITSRDRYPLSKDTHVRVEPVFRTPAILCAATLASFGLGFHDLLFAGELAAITVAIFVLIFARFQFAQLLIIDRVTRGTEQMIAVSGLNYSLQKHRAEIDAAIDELKGGDA